MREAYQAEMVARGNGASGPQARDINGFANAIATRVAEQLAGAPVVETVGIFLTEQERRHISNILTDIEILQESAQRRNEVPEAGTYAAEHAALFKLSRLLIDSHAAEFSDLRAMKARLEELATEWEDGVHPTATELRNRMKGTP